MFACKEQDFFDCPKQEGAEMLLLICDFFLKARFRSYIRNNNVTFLFI